MEEMIDYFRRLAAERRLKDYRFYLACALIALAYFFGKTRRLR